MDRIRWTLQAETLHVILTRLLAFSLKLPYAIIDIGVDGVFQDQVSSIVYSLKTIEKLAQSQVIESYIYAIFTTSSLLIYEDPSIENSTAFLQTNIINFTEFQLLE